MSDSKDGKSATGIPGPDPPGPVPEEISRRSFLKCAGVVVIGAGAGVSVGAPGCAESGDEEDGRCEYPDLPKSRGYVLVDTKKCQGCLSCMLACSLVHEGVENLSLARIQVLQDPFAKWPHDLTIEQCRQCVDPACVQACPQCAIYVDEEAGNVRRVDRELCIGCGKCVQACPFQPKRPIIAADPEFDGAPKSRKCDLCLDTPYWKHEGGPRGRQACVEICPLEAITFTSEVPEQKGDSGYKVNLRGEAWAALGFPTD
jgi:Fe-S-cluster-containing dehydrogenase component